jgi:hypothetical protein
MSESNDFVMFIPGAGYIYDHGIPTTCTFGLSTKSVDDHDRSGDDLAEITGTGYERQGQPAPESRGGVVMFDAAVFETGEAVDWPRDVRSVILFAGDTPVCAWNLVPRGEARDLSQAYTLERVSPSLGA